MPRAGGRHYGAVADAPSFGRLGVVNASIRGWSAYGSLAGTGMLYWLRRNCRVAASVAKRD